jgi:predicted translin family RNA/ssDNA-binding protein
MKRSAITRDQLMQTVREMKSHCQEALKELVQWKEDAFEDAAKEISEAIEAAQKIGI